MQQHGEIEQRYWITLNGETKRDGFEISWMVRYEGHNKGYCTKMPKKLFTRK